ncbi:hypothetical protein BVX93_00875, partial [bacterium B13(2017)]
MGNVKPFGLEKLFTGVIINSSQINISQVKQVLIGKFGELDYESNAIDFTHTSYYAKEMGEPLCKYFFSFKKLINP